MSPRPTGASLRFLAYARARGLSPSAAISADQVDYPGGSMAGFIVWIHRRWGEWAREVGHPRASDMGAHFSNSDHDSFDAWLSTALLGGKLRGECDA